LAPDGKTPAEQLRCNLWRRTRQKGDDVVHARSSGACADQSNR
jgi:hypothetical protein